MDISNSLTKHLVEARQRLAGTSKDDKTAHRSVQPVGNTQKHIARLGIFRLDIIFDKFAKWPVTRLVALHNLARSLIDNYYMVVFVEYLH